MAAAVSLRDRLQAQRERRLAPKTLTLRVPGWTDPEVHVRYRPLDWEKLSAMIEQAGDGPLDPLGANLQSLVDACDALMVRDAGDREPVSLAARLREAGDDVPGEVRFGELAVDVLGLTVPGEGDGPERPARTARETALGLFAGAVSPEIAVAEHAARLGAWMRGVQEEVDDSLLGE